MPLAKPVEAVEEGDLQALVSAGVQDARTLEFKRELPRPTDAGREDFLNDVASFANAVGGNILYGVKSREGAAVELTGVEESAVDAALAWLELAVNTGIAPGLPGLRFKVIELQNGSCILLLRVPQTWAGPHMVTFRHSNRFYSRNAAGRCLLDVDELRAAFTLGEGLAGKLRAFRLDRVNMILNRSLSVPMAETPKTVLHILPVAAFRVGFRIDLEQVTAGDAQAIRPMEARGVVSHYNYDGLMTFSTVEKYAYSYIQVFRNGCLEACESRLLSPKDGRKFFPSALFESEVIHCGERLLGLLRRLQIEPPFVVMLSFLGVRGYSMFVGSMRWQSNAQQIERDNLFPEDVIITDSRQEFSRIMRPAFDQVWNACGWARSLNYDADGNWRVHSH